MFSIGMALTIFNNLKKEGFYNRVVLQQDYLGPSSKYVISNSLSQVLNS